MKIIIYFIASILLSSCASMYTQQNVKNAALLEFGMYTQQNVKNIALLEPGMEQKKVLEIMGSPAKIEFSGKNKALHYCNTGRGSDEYAVVILSSGKVVAAKNYVVTLAELGYATGDCSRFVKSVDLERADSVQEIRFR